MQEVRPQSGDHADSKRNAVTDLGVILKLEPWWWDVRPVAFEHNESLVMLWKKLRLVRAYHQERFGYPSLRMQMYKLLFKITTLNSLERHAGRYWIENYMT